MKRTITMLTLSVSFFAAMNAYCQPQQTPRDLQYIMEMAGKWDGPATLRMGGKELHTTYFADFRKTASNSGLEMFEHCDIPGMGTLTATNLIGLDPNDGKIHWYTVDNLGTTHEHTGSFTDHDHFTMMHKSMKEGKAYVENISMERMGKDKVKLKIIATSDGVEEEAIDVVFNRRGAKAVTAK